MEHFVWGRRTIQIKWLFYIESVIQQSIISLRHYLTGKMQKKRLLPKSHHIGLLAIHDRKEIICQPFQLWALNLHVRENDIAALYSNQCLNFFLEGKIFSEKIKRKEKEFE